MTMFNRIPPSARSANSASAPLLTLALLAIPLLPSSPAAAPIPPQATGSGYAFTFPAGGPSLEVEAANGARVTSLKLGTNEFLFLDRSQTNWGSTFWTAPQSAWNWPPPQAYDGATYTGGPQGDALVLAGPKDQASGFSFTKRFYANDLDTSFALVLTLRNGGTSPRQAAPWQITRVPPGGLTFFAKGPGAERGTLVSQVKEIAGWKWFDFETAVIPGGTAKYFADGSGWMAHLDKNGLLLLEFFPDVPADLAAPEEAEIEIYSEPGKRYEEIEHQGTYVSISAGDSTVWTTRWLLRKLPPGIARTAGDPALVAWVAALVRGYGPLSAHPRNAQVSYPGRSAGPRLSLRPGDAGAVDAKGRKPGKRRTATSGE